MVKVLRSIVRGPLEPHVVGLAEELLRQGYSRTSAEQHVCFVAHLDRWMSAEGVGIGELSDVVLERYLQERRGGGYVEYRSMKALQPLLGYLAPLRVLPAGQGGRPDAVEELLGRYRDYLVGERFDRALITYLTDPEVDALLAACDQATWTGRRDHALLLLAAQTGLRISELTTLIRADLHLGTGPHVACHGLCRIRHSPRYAAAWVMPSHGCR